MPNKKNKTKFISKVNNNQVSLFGVEKSRPQDSARSRDRKEAHPSMEKVVNALLRRPKEKKGQKRGQKRPSITQMKGGEEGREER